MPRLKCGDDWDSREAAAALLTGGKWSPGGGGMLSRGNRLDGRRVASLTLLASEKGGEGGGGRPRGGTGMPAEWDR